MVKYTVGMRVEIVGHEDGFWNSYHGARVRRVDRTKLLVRYEELIDDDGEYIVEERGEVASEGDDELTVYFSYMPRNELQGTYARDDVRIHQDVKDVGKGFAWQHVNIVG
ncbi:hypothetical protein LXL04_003844 [Taraxacum kok-saghyz]